jgi:hypothetical protein
LKYISDHLYVPKKTAGVAERVAQSVAGFFRAASNLFGPSEESDSWSERLTDAFARLRARIREFDYRDVVAWFGRARQQKVQVQPSDSQELAEAT